MFKFCSSSELKPTELKIVGDRPRILRRVCKPHLARAMPGMQSPRRRSGIWLNWLGSQEVQSNRAGACAGVGRGASECAAGLVSETARELLGMDDNELQIKVEQLVLLVPSLQARIPRLQASLLAGLLQDIRRLSYRMVRQLK